MCHLGYYEIPTHGTNTHDDYPCEQCPSNKVSNCDADNLKVQSLELRPGFYRYDENSSAAYILPCPYSGEVACMGGLATGDDLCEHGYTSVLCAACDSDFHFLVDKCKACSDKWLTWGAALFALVGTVVVVVAVVMFVSRSDSRSHMLRNLAEYACSTLGNQAKIVWSGAQISSAFPFLVFNVLPANLKSFYTRLSVTNLNPASLLSLACFHHDLGSYFSELVCATTTPIALAIINAMVYLVRTTYKTASREDTQRLYEQHLQLFLMLCYLALPSVCTVIFSAFTCETDFDSLQQVSFLQADYGTDCNSDEYRHWILPWAFTSIALYPVGVNVMYAITLFRNRYAIKDGRADHIGFLHDAYGEHAWFWEPIDSIRRISLTGVLVFFTSKGIRLAVGMLFSFGWLLLYYRVAPFARMDDQLLAEIVNIEIVFSIMMLILHYSSLISNDAVIWLCISVNVGLIPILLCFLFKEFRHGWLVIKSLGQGRQIDESFHEDWFMRYWEAGSTARSFLRDRTTAWLEHALESPPEEIACSILKILRLPPFQDIDGFDEQGMGIVVELGEQGGTSFATLTRVKQEDTPSLVSRVGNPMMRMHAQCEDEDIEMRMSESETPESQAEPTQATNARLVRSGQPDLHVQHVDTEFAIKVYGGKERRFEAVLMYALQRLFMHLGERKGTVR